MLDPVRWAQKFATAADFEAAVLADCEREVGCDVAFFSVVGREASPSVLGLDAATIARAASGSEVYARELLPVKRAALARRGVAVDSEVLGDERMRKARYYQEVAAPVGGKHSLLAYMAWQGQPFGMLMLGRTGRAFSSSEVERVEAMLPALGVARAAYGLPAARTVLPQANQGAVASLAARFGFERVLGSVETPSGRVSVRDRRGFREMVAAREEHELVWSRARLTDAAASGWPYLELFHVAAACARQRERALFVGLGGAVSVRQFARVYPGIVCDVVEKEEGVITLAREFFELDAIPRVTVHVGDGAEFIANAAAESFDVVVIDAYDAMELGAAFSTRRFFASLRRALRPGGAVGINVIGALAGNGPVGRVVQALSKELAELRVIPVTQPGEALAPNALRNVVVVAVRPSSE